MQLEEAGLVVRTSVGDDGRGVLATMTSEGLRRFRDMERSHASSIQAHFSAHLSDEEAAVITPVFARIADAGRAALVPPR